MMSPKQENIMRGFARHDYFQLSATEAGDPEISELFERGLVESYWGGGVMWHLTKSGREMLVEMGLSKTSKRPVIDAASGTVEFR